MRIPALFRSALLLSSACAIGAGTAMAQFPDMPGKDAALKVCGSCHEPERASSLHQDRDGWDATMSAMAGRGMDIPDAQYKTVLDYLSKAFPGEAPKPLNINTAEAIDLETAFSLLRSQAALVIAYRDKHGKFKSLDDLKKVPGFDFSKIEDKKDRIAF
jgi:competence protein ComEA